MMDRKNQAMQAATKAYCRVVERKRVWLRSGGTILVGCEFQRVHGIPTVSMEFASPGNNLLSQNEKFSIKNFYRGILTSMAFKKEFRRKPAPARKQYLLTSNSQYDR